MRTSLQAAEGAEPSGRLAQLQDFRRGFYGCLTGWGDALFELTDAVLSAPGPVGSVPSLSLGEGCTVVVRPSVRAETLD